MQRALKRKIYLDNIPLEEARERFFSALELPSPLPQEIVSVEDSLGRVTGAPAYARISSPHYHSSAMDGIAVRAEATFGASEARPIRLALGREAFPVDTGDPLPPGTDAVVMIEQVHELPEEGMVELRGAATPWQHVRVAGEDIVVGQLILPEGHRIRPYDMGALLAGGLTSVAVRRKPSVVIIPTGDELVRPGDELKEGNIIEFNSTTLAGFVRQWGGEPIVHPIVPDSRESLREAAAKALERADILIINAGSSAGSQDYTAPVVEELGEVLVHGVAINPGKPTLLGVARGKPLVGVPGYPVSAALAMHEFVEPLIARFLGAMPQEEPEVRARISRKVPSKLGSLELLRVRLGEVEGKMVALPLKRGAGIITSLVEADGIVRIASTAEGVEPGEEVTVTLLRPISAVRNNILLAGSHDNSLDLLANELKARFPQYTLSTASLGSLGGLLALKEGEAHLAGSHLLDPSTGEYNSSYVERYLPGRELIVMNFLYREQGLMVFPGNPKGIRGIEDLARKDVRFVNRQGGAGTRILLDLKLGEAGISPSQVQGYERVEYTHMAVAMAVRARRADVGLGILAAARALGLDFIPMERERYDLIIPLPFMNLPGVRALLEVMGEKSFKEKVKALGGYDVSRMGEVLSRKGGARA